MKQQQGAGQLAGQNHSSLRKRVVLGLTLGLVILFAVRWQASAGPAAAPAPVATPEAAVQQAQLADLARLVGRLEGRVRALEILQERLATEAGLAYEAPEFNLNFMQGTVPPARAGGLAAAPVADVRAAHDLRPVVWALESAVLHQEDVYDLAALALARREAAQSRLPTLMPVWGASPSSAFGWRRRPLGRGFAMHQGVDLAAVAGTPVRAASGGVVVRAGTVPGYGRLVELDHGNGLRTRYAHASRLLVRRGDIVPQGHPIARVGSSGRSTGSHLHFEVRLARHALDPASFLREQPRGLPAPDQASVQAVR